MADGVVERNPNAPPPKKRNYNPSFVAKRKPQTPGPTAEVPAPPAAPKLAPAEPVAPEAAAAPIAPEALPVQPANLEPPKHLHQ